MHHQPQHQHRLRKAMATEAIVVQGSQHSCDWWQGPCKSMHQGTKTTAAVEKLGNVAVHDTYVHAETCAYTSIMYI